jgi:hypothetical protein
MGMAPDCEGLRPRLLTNSSCLPLRMSVTHPAGVTTKAVAATTDRAAAAKRDGGISRAYNRLGVQWLPFRSSQALIPSAWDERFASSRNMVWTMF